MTSHHEAESWADQVEGLLGVLMGLFKDSQNTVRECEALCREVEASPADGPVLITLEHWLRLCELRDKKAGIDRRIEEAIDLLGRGQ